MWHLEKIVYCAVSIIAFVWIKTYGKSCKCVVCLADYCVDVISVWPVPHMSCQKNPCVTVARFSTQLRVRVHHVPQRCPEKQSTVYSMSAGTELLRASGCGASACAKTCRSLSRQEDL